MRLMVRRLNSPFTASKPSAIASSGNRKPSIEAKEGSGACATASRARNR
jgi:hypothetical protein